MGAKTGNKSGRPLKQNGKSKVPEKEDKNDGPDFSVLRKPVEISVLGLSEVLKVFQSCTPELRHLLSYECDVIYECKVCRNLFRSLANFISHKRVYCTQLHNCSQTSFKNNRRVDDTTVIVQPESVRTTRARENSQNSSSAGDKNKKEVSSSKPRKNGDESVPFRITVKKDLTSIVEKLMQKNANQTFTEVMGHVSSSSEFYDGVSQELEVRRREAKEHTVHLEPIENTSFGVFQTVVQSSGSSSNLIKSQVEDLQKIISDTEVVLGPDGKVVENGSAPGPNFLHQQDKRKKCKAAPEAEYSGPRVTAPESEVELFCNICKAHFSSFKTLNQHMKSLHTMLRTFYPCPCCKLPFSNSWSVYRHLLKVHRKTNEQIRKLREKVIKRSFKKEILLTGAQKLSKPNVAENPLCPSEVIYDTSTQVPVREEDSDKQWFGHQGDGLDLQCCGGCGRRFERRAALLAHSQSCLKLMAAKQNVSSASRPLQSDKPTTAPSVPAAVGRPFVQLNKLTSVSPSVIPALWSSSIPVHPLNHTIHLNQEKDVTPAKKIEIQVRKDYGKALAATEYRTRTSSTSRSDDGAGSTGRSDDGMTSGSSETEASGVSNSNQRSPVKQEGNCLKSSDSRSVENSEIKNGKLLSNTQAPNSPQNISKLRSFLKRGVGRPPKRRSDFVHVNGVVDTRQAGNSIDNTGDESLDVLKEDLQVQCNSTDSRKRKAVIDLTSDNKVRDVEEISSSDVSRSKRNLPGLSSRQTENHNLEKASNADKLQCLVCQKVFKTLCNLKRHLAMHIGWNRFRCIICDFRCFSKFDCISHALSIHLDPWEKEKAAALVQDMQMDAGGSTDVQADSGDSDSMGSEKSVSQGSLSCHQVLNRAEDNHHNSIECFQESTESETSTSVSTLTHEGPVIDEVGEMITVA